MIERACAHGERGYRRAAQAHISLLFAHNKLTEVMRVIPCTDNACAYQDDGVCRQNRAVSGDGTKPECAYFVGKSGREELRADCALAAKLDDSPADANAESDL
ncbi:MAG: hypothetical protein LBK23_04715 [Oscillospiraceae bacterium]|nr:hypothetical protein [Oscillospiraceae bacterium]